MNVIAKVLIPNKCWIVEEHGSKLGTLNKEKKGYSFFRKGDKTDLSNIKDVKEIFGPDLFSNISEYSKFSNKEEIKAIYDYPCSSRPFNPVYNVKKKLPIYAKSSKSKSLYCAGYYIIKFRKGWVKSFCPKLITLERYPYQGPFKTENEMKNVLVSVNKNE